MIGIADCDWSVPKPWSDLCQSISYILRTTATDDTLVAWKLDGLGFVLEVQEHSLQLLHNGIITFSKPCSGHTSMIRPSQQTRRDDQNLDLLQLVVFLKERKRDVGVHVSLLALYWSRKFALFWRTRIGSQHNCSGGWSLREIWLPLYSGTEI